MNFYVILHFTKSVRKIFNLKERSHFLSWPSLSCFTCENSLSLLTEFIINYEDRLAEIAFQNVVLLRKVAKQRKEK